jgi:glyoxylase-like metal-dependent hydrolase (beta-lactamase superfamily II)
MTNTLSRLRRPAAAGVLLLVACSLWIWFRQNVAGSPAPFSRARVPRLAREACTVVPGVHLLGGLSPSAAYVVETTAGLVLIDSGLDADAHPLNAEMETLELDWRKIVAIALTHAHGDHCGAAQTLREATGARIYAGVGDLPVLEAGEPREAFFNTFYVRDHAPHPTTMDVPLRGGERIELGKLGLPPGPPTAVLLPSCDPPATAGLTELIEKHRVQVVAAPEASALLKKKCPPGTTFLSCPEASKQGWFAADPVRLEGRGLFPTAYRLELSGKQVL